MQKKINYCVEVHAFCLYQFPLTKGLFSSSFLGPGNCEKGVHFHTEISDILNRMLYFQFTHK